MLNKFKIGDFVVVKKELLEEFVGRYNNMYMNWIVKELSRNVLCVGLVENSGINKNDLDLLIFSHNKNYKGLYFLAKYFEKYVK